MICKQTLSAICVLLHLSLILPYISVLKTLAYLELTSHIEADNVYMSADCLFLLELRTMGTSLSVLMGRVLQVKGCTSHIQYI